MKKLFSKIFTSLLILGVMTGCGTTISSSENPTSESPVSSEITTSEPPVVNKKLGLSLASKVTTDRGIIIAQNNDVSKPKRRSKIKSLEGGTSKDELKISAVEIPHTLIESSENSFDLAIEGLVDGEFSIKIEKNLTDNDVTSEFSWVFVSDRESNERVTCPIIGESTVCQQCKPLSGEHYFLKQVKDGTEIRIFRLFSETYDFKASDLKISVSQSITETSSSPRLLQNETISSDLILTSFDFEMKYDNSLDYTDLNNIGFSITSELFEVKYTNNLDLNVFYDEGTPLSMSLTDENKPYEAITIVYRRDGTEDDFVAINNYLVVFPHLGGIKNEENPNPRLALGYKTQFIDGQTINYFNPDSSFIPDQPWMRVYNNIWTGINRQDAKILISGLADWPLVIPEDLKTPENVLIAYYSLDDLAQMSHPLYDERIVDVIKFDLSFKLYIDGVIFDLGKMYEIDDPKSPFNGRGAFTMNPSQPIFK